MLACPRGVSRLGNKPHVKASQEPSSLERRRLVDADHVRTDYSVRFEGIPSKLDNANT